MSFMLSQELLQSFQERADEARLYFSQGLQETAIEILEEILREIDQSGLSEAEKEDVRSLIRPELQKMGLQDVSSAAQIGAAEESSTDELTNPSQIFQYGLALMDGLFWEEAIREFKRAAAVGYRTAECWELCGDCASLLERWEEAIRYYNIVYRDENLPEDLRRKILIKITRCSQTQKKLDARAFPQIGPEVQKGGSGFATDLSRQHPSSDLAAQAVASVDQATIGRLFGLYLHSWKNDKGQYLARKPGSYRVLNLLHVGISSVVVELEEEETGKRLAGQSFFGPFSGSLTLEKLADWVYTQLVSGSRNLVKVLDLAHAGDLFFIVREYLPVSLVELLSRGEVLPLPLAVFLAYRVLEGVGDLHLRMGSDEQIRRIYHLDLRPSRVLMDSERLLVKINNGGLWEQLQKSNPDATAIERLPLPLLAYRAPEQFRPYLARRKPPVFTDIYLFGTLFYEMLTGIPAFRASSYEEYEIQHCEQYPTPPKVWRPEIPDQLNEMVMKCLESDPVKRWRSATELSLLLEKPFYRFISPPRDGSFAKFLKYRK